MVQESTAPFHAHLVLSGIIYNYCLTVWGTESAYLDHLCHYMIDGKILGVAAHSLLWERTQDNLILCCIAQVLGFHTSSHFYHIQSSPLPVSCTMSCVYAVLIEGKQNEMSICFLI